jgi:hypothetical protein
MSGNSVRNKFRFSMRTVPRINFTQKNGNNLNEFTLPVREEKFLQSLSRKIWGSNLGDLREVVIKMDVKQIGLAGVK